MLPDRTIAVDVVALNAGFQPEVGLARALGVPHRFVDSGLGHLATETDEDGRTSLGSVFAVGDGAALGGARVAAARGRLAGLAAARDLGHAAPEDSRTRRALRRALAFQDALWRVFPLPPVDPGSIADETIVCRCEEVTAGAVARRARGGSAVAGGVEEGDAGRHGTLPGPVLRGDGCPALSGRGGTGRFRRPASAGAAGAGGASDARGAGIPGAVAGGSDTAIAQCRQLGRAVQRADRGDWRRNRRPVHGVLSGRRVARMY